MRVQLALLAPQAPLGSEVQQDREAPLVPQGVQAHKVPPEQQERKVSRVRRALLVPLAVTGCRVLWGFLVQRDPQVWLERMGTRVRWGTQDRRVPKGTKASMALLDLLVPSALWASPELRELMGSLELGGPRDTLEPKATKGQEDSMGPRDPLASRACQDLLGRREKQETWGLWDPLALQDLAAPPDPMVLTAHKVPLEVLGTWVPLETRGSRESLGLQASRVSRVSRVHVENVVRKERLGRRERLDHQGLKALQAMMAPRGTLVLLAFLGTLGPLEKLAHGARMVPRVTGERMASQDSLDPLVPLGRMGPLDPLGSGDLLAPLVQRDDKERREPRGTLVLSGPQERQALWVLQARRESLALMVCGGSQAQWVNKVVLEPQARLDPQVLWDPQGFLASGVMLEPRERRATPVSSD